MTISASLLTANHGGSASSFATASATYAAGKWYKAVILNESSPDTSHNTPTIAGWTLDGRVDDTARGTVNITVLWFLGDGSTSALTIDFAGQSQSFVNWQILEWTGTHVGSSPIVQSHTNVGSGTTETDSLAAFADPVNNATFVAGSGFMFDLVQNAGYTLISGATGDFSFITAYKIGQDLAPAMHSTSSDAWVLYAAEIAAPGSTGGIGSLLGRATLGAALLGGSMIARHRAPSRYQQSHTGLFLPDRSIHVPR